jgi:hypothetical protein
VYEWVGDWPWLLVSGGLIYAAFRRRRGTAAAGPSSVHVERLKTA